MRRALRALWHVPGRLWAGMMASGSLATWAQIGAGVAFTLFSAVVLALLAFGPWTGATERTRADGVFWMGMGGLGLVLVALVAIAQLKLGFKGSRAGIEASVERDDDRGSLTLKAEATEEERP